MNECEGFCQLTDHRGEMSRADVSHSKGNDIWRGTMEGVTRDPPSFLLAFGKQTEEIEKREKT